jgi:hypothetical protein
VNRVLVSVALAAATVAAILAARAFRGDPADPSNGAAGGVTKPPEMHSGDQYDLLKAITQAEAMNAEKAEERYLQIRREWSGKRVHWRVFVIPQLCQSADQCHVMPFDRFGKDKKVLQGWMPKLEIDSQALAAIHKSCAQQKRCSIEFEGTLSQFTLSTEFLTNLRFSDVKIL